MSKPVTIVIPALDDRALLAAHLPAVLAELRARNVGDEVVVVDDTGSGVLESWLTQQFPPPATFDAASVDVRCVVRAENGGYAAAARSGVEAAAHDLVYLLNPDVRVEPGFLAPLVAAMEDTHVVAAVGRTVLCGDPSHVETLLVPQWRNGRLVMREHGTRPEDASHEPAEAAFALGGAALVRRAEFLRQRHDPLYAPFYLEDLDQGLEWRAQGRRIAYCPDSRASHDHRGSIGPRVPAAWVRLWIERNLLVCAWKHADEDLLDEHFQALEERLLDALQHGDRATLTALVLACDDATAAAKARAKRTQPRRSLRDLLSEAQP